MLSRILSKEEEDIYKSLTIYYNFKVLVKNDVFEELKDELDSVLVAANLLDYKIEFSYAKSGVTCILSFNNSDHSHYSKIRLLFHCQNEIRELDYISLQTYNNDSFSDLFIGYREDYNLITWKDEIAVVGLHIPLQTIKNIL